MNPRPAGYSSLGFQHEGQGFPVIEGISASIKRSLDKVIFVCYGEIIEHLGPKSGWELEPFDGQLRNLLQFVDVSVSQYRSVCLLRVRSVHERTCPPSLGVHIHRRWNLDLAHAEPKHGSGAAPLHVIPEALVIQPKLENRRDHVREQGLAIRKNILGFVDLGSSHERLHYSNAVSHCGVVIHMRCRTLRLIHPRHPIRQRSGPGCPRTRNRRRWAADAPAIQCASQWIRPICWLSFRRTCAARKGRHKLVLLEKRFGEVADPQRRYAFQVRIHHDDRSGVQLSGFVKRLRTLFPLPTIPSPVEMYIFGVLVGVSMNAVRCRPANCCHIDDCGGELIEILGEPLVRLLRRKG